MTKQDYRLTISAPVSASDAYDKVARVSDWWTRYVVGSTTKLGDKFNVRFSEEVGGTSVDFNIAEAVPEKKVVWHVTNCYLPWLKNQTEWNDTRVIFDISQGPSATTVTLTHEGLTPGMECFNQCEKGWNHHFGESMKRFLIDGHGTPI